jgi:hypothetical protein
MPSDPRTSKDKLLEKPIDFLSVVEFLKGLVEKEVGFTHHLDSQTNILISISTALFLLASSSFLGGDKELSLLIISLFSGLSTLVGLLAIHPPRFMREQGQEESIMFTKSISRFKSAKDFEEEVLKTVVDHEKIVSQFSLELYNLSKYYYRPKRLLFRWARNLLLLGIGLGLFSFLIEILVKTSI